jgi:hypothetical protein
MVTPPGPVSPGFPSGSGSRTAGKSARALTGDVDILSRVSSDGTAVFIQAVSADIELVPSPPTGNIRVVQRACIQDVIVAGAASICQIYVAVTDSGTVEEMLDQNRVDVAIGGDAKMCRARIPGMVFLHGAQSIRVKADISGDASARYFDILVVD